MATLADSFLDDLDDLSGSEDEEEQQQQGEKSNDGEVENADQDMADDLEDDLEEGGDQLESVLVMRGGTDLSSVASLRSSERFKSHIARMNEADAQKEVSLHSAEADSLYDLIVESNELLQELDEEVLRVHRFVVDLYATKFPELENLVPAPLDYARVAERIGNEMDMTLVDLSDLLPSAQVMVVTVTGSTTNGQPLSEDVLRAVRDGAEEVEALGSAKQRVMRFIEDRMTTIAPNVSALVGSSVAAKMLSTAGGLDPLSRMPSCNVQTLGGGKKVLSGFSTAATLPSTGLIYFCPLVQSAPPSLRMKACRVTGGRVTLAARLDATKGAPNGCNGRQWYDEIAAKIEKWQAPQQGKSKKALPVPGAHSKRKRGGKRYRAMKEKFGLTDVRREANRMMMGPGKGEYSDSAMGHTFGSLGVEGSGKIRITKKEKKQAAKKQRRAVTSASSGASGLSSSLAFTPVQGLELMNPEIQAAKVRAANSKYFGSSSGFQSTINQGK